MFAKIKAGDDGMAGRCTLAGDLNKCAFYNAENGNCENPEKKCLFLETERSEPQKPIRTEKWFEQYIR